MTKAELIDIVTEQVEGASKADVSRIYDLIFQNIEKSLKVDNRYAVGGFGTFDLKQRAARKGRNPQTGQEIDIPASKTVNFKMASALKESINQ